MRELERALRLEEIGDECIERKKYAEAILHLTKAIKLQPKNPRFYEKRSSAFFMMGLPYYAYQDTQELISLDPENMAGYCKKGSIEYDTGNYHLAWTTFTNVSTWTRKLCIIEDYLTFCRDYKYGAWKIE